MNNICDICGLPFERTCNSQKRHNGGCLKEYRRQRMNTPEYKEHDRQRKNTPKYKEYRRQYNRKYYQRYYASASKGTINFLQILSLKQTINKQQHYEKPQQDNIAQNTHRQRIP